MTNINIPPGLFDENIELFSHDGKAMALYNGSAVHIFELPKDILNILSQHLINNKSAFTALELSGFETFAQKLEKYVMCRFGHFDHSPDIKDGEVRDSEYYECGFRGTCQMEGVVCSLVVVNKRVLSAFEIQMIKLLAKEDIIPVIAEKLNVSLNTLETRKKILFEKLGVFSRARMVSKCYELGILNPALCSG